MRNALLFALLLLPIPQTHAGELRVGAAPVVITPPEGTPLAGYYSPRGAKSVLDDIRCKAIVLEKDGTKAALVVCDLISLPPHTVRETRRVIEKETGVPGANVMLSATHTHTGPALYRESSIDELVGATGDLGKRYTDALPEQIAKCVAEAEKKLTAAHAAAGSTREEGVSFNRRFRMKDGTVSWNPAKRHPDIVRPAGPIDPQVGVVLFEGDKGRPLATYVNFALHPDTTGGAAVSADYPGHLARLLAECKGPEMVTVFANGCCGNINHRDIAWADPQHGTAEAKRIGTVLAGDVLKTYPRLRPIADGALRVKSTKVPLDLPEIFEPDVAKANDVVKRVKDPKTTFLEKVKAFQVLDVAARKGKPWEVEVQVVALGDVAWVSLPGEIFVELGLDIKKSSPFAHTHIAELANGSVGYIPNRAAYLEGNYEVVSARVAAGSGEKLVAAATKLLNELHATK
jgi:neutral ceramidase